MKHYPISHPAGNTDLKLAIHNTLPEIDRLDETFEAIFDSVIGEDVLSSVELLMSKARRHRVYRADLLRHYPTFCFLAEKKGVTTEHIPMLWKAYTNGIFNQAPYGNWAHDKPMKVILKEINLNRKHANEHE